MWKRESKYRRPSTGGLNSDNTLLPYVNHPEKQEVRMTLRGPTARRKARGLLPAETRAEAVLVCKDTEEAILAFTRLV